MDAVCVDWDDTLVDVTTQQWLPDAISALRALQQRGYRVIVHSCRANWPEGKQQIQSALDAAGLADVSIEPKPHAVAYIDNLARRYEGDWKQIMATLPPTAAVMRRLAGASR